MSLHEIKKFVNDYYELLDNQGDLERLQSFFDDKGFEIIEGDFSILNKDAYASWYKQTNQVFQRREHTIRSMEIDTIEEGYYVLIDMLFGGLKCNGETTKVEAKIKWHLKNEDEHFKIRRYEIIRQS